MRARARATALTLAAAALLTLPAAAEAAAPEVIDTWVASAGATAVDANAFVAPGGTSTQVALEFLTEAEHEANLTASPPRDGFTGAAVSPPAGVSIGAGTGPVSVTRHVGGLRPATVYRYRFAATNADGVVHGPSRLFTTRPNSQQGFALLDGRGWEMVSPIDKNGGGIQAPGELFGGGVPQAAASGGSVTYGSLFAFAGGAGAPGASQYLSARSAGGWSTTNITTPIEAGAFGPGSDGPPAQLASADLSRTLFLDPERCDAPPCGRRYLLRDNASGVSRASPSSQDLRFAGADPGLRDVVLATCAALTPEATEVPEGDGCDPEERNLYDWTQGGLELINVLPGDQEGTPGAGLAAEVGAVSDDGERVYFTQGGGLYLRRLGQTTQVDEGLGGGGHLQVTAADGSIAFFTKEGHLYRRSVGGPITDLSAAGEVDGVLGASPDGAFVYYATATGAVLMHHDGESIQVAGSADAASYVGEEGRARVAPGGNLLFLSREPLTDVDTGGFPAAFLYRPATDELTCVSCSPTGSRPLGPATIPGLLANGTLPEATRAYRPRALSADGLRVFFDSFESLVPTDTNADRDVYEWEAEGVGSCGEPDGCLALISSGRSEEGARFLDASADGSDVFFLTDGSLVATDPGATDVYDARVGGGFPAPPPPLSCEGDNCQVLPPEPASPALGTAFLTPEGNPRPHYKKPKRHKKRRHRKHKRRKAGAKHGRNRGGRR